jgi:hypothetical protein
MDQEFESSSDLVISFNNIRTELLNLYQNGKSYSESLLTLSGHEWKIDIFPNGDKFETENKITICVTLIKLAESVQIVDAEFIYKISNEQKTWTKRSNRLIVEVNKTFKDSTFETNILNDNNVTFSLQIVQYPITCSTLKKILKLLKLIK